MVSLFTAFQLFFEKGAFASAFSQSGSPSATVGQITHGAKSLHDFYVEDVVPDTTAHGAYWIRVGS